MYEFFALLRMLLYIFAHFFLISLSSTHSYRIQISESQMGIVTELEVGCTFSRGRCVAHRPLLFLLRKD